MIEQAYASGFGPLSEGGKNYKMYVATGELDDNLLNTFLDIKNAPMHSTFILGVPNVFSASGNVMWTTSTLTATTPEAESEEQMGILPLILYTSQVFPNYTEITQEESSLILDSPTLQELRTRTMQVYSKYQS